MIINIKQLELITLIMVCWRVGFWLDRRTDELANSYTVTITFAMCSLERLDGYSHRLVCPFLAENGILAKTNHFGV